jgi:hypothetical protein
MLVAIAILGQREVRLSRIMSGFTQKKSHTHVHTKGVRTHVCNVVISGRTSLLTRVKNHLRVISVVLVLDKLATVIGLKKQCIALEKPQSMRAQLVKMNMGALLRSSCYH